MPHHHTRHYMLSSQFVSALGSVGPNWSLLDKDEETGLALVQLGREEFHQMTRLIRNRTTFCGGIMDVQTDIKGHRDTIRKILQSRTKTSTITLPEVPQFDTDQRVRSIIGSLTAGSLRNFVADFTDHHRTRHWETKEGREASNFLYNYIQELLSKSPRSSAKLKKFEFKDEPNASDLQYSFVVTIPGSAPSTPGVLIGAHLDTHIDTDYGVDDDASGVATVVEALRAVAYSPLTFKGNTYFAFYAAEEPGMLGSQIIAREFADSAVPLRGVMQLDMTAYRKSGDKQLYFFLPSTNAKLTSLTQQIAARYLQFKNQDFDTTNCGGTSCDSDHWSWDLHNYATVFPFEASSGNPYIHTSGDTLFVKELDWDHAKKFLVLATAFTIELAEPL